MIRSDALKAFAADFVVTAAAALAASNIAPASFSELFALGNIIGFAVAKAAAQAAVRAVLKWANS